MRFLKTAGVVSAAPDMERDRAKIKNEYKWNLSDIYLNLSDWQADKKKLVEMIPSLAAFSGKLSTANGLHDCLVKYFQLTESYAKLYSYASLLSDEDTRESKPMAMEQELAQIGTNLSSVAAFVEPEILQLTGDQIKTFMQTVPELSTYQHYLNDILRRKAHTNTESEEKIIAMAGLISDNAHSIYNVFSNAEFPYPEITLENGNRTKLDQATFSTLRASTNRNDRSLVFTTFFSRLNEYRRTFGAQLYGQLKKAMFYKSVRRYTSCLQAALDGDNIPEEVYRNHIRNVNRHLPSFHRYLKLRERILKLEQLHYHDLYAPLVAEAETVYSPEEAGQHVTKSLTPLGEEYTRVIRQALNNRWIDMYPNEGKRSGAYSNGSLYDVHPYILMNFKGRYDDVSTLTHELGHTMHSYFSNKHQPFVNSHYSIFVAEVASTFNEALLIDHMLGQIDDPPTQLALLGHYLEGFKGTVFRQTQFAEFELAIHEIAENGEALTGDRFNELYLDLVRKYYGHSEKICLVDDCIQSEWSYIPHFYYNFYVYQYATSFTASAALSENVLAGDLASKERYLELLKAGGSDYPINLLKKAGVDMMTENPMNLAMQKMNRVMDDMEQLLTEIPS